MGAPFDRCRFTDLTCFTDDVTKLVKSDSSEQHPLKVEWTDSWKASDS